MGIWWVRSDPCGIFSAGLTVFLILYAQFVMVSVVILPWYGFGIHFLVYSFCSAMAVISHCRAQFTDPGAVPKTLEPVHADPSNPTPLRLCKKCRIPKPVKAHHCSTCARCVIHMDHHCPWVNNCVGIFNQKYFLLFLLYTNICCIYSGVMLVSRFISCTNQLKTCPISGVGAALSIINFVEALVFGLFTIIMMFDQISAILDNTPGIDAMQNKKGEKRGKYESLISVFGENFSLRWFLPLEMPLRTKQEFHFELQQQLTEEEANGQKSYNSNSTPTSTVSSMYPYHEQQQPSQPLQQRQQISNSEDIPLDEVTSHSETESEDSVPLIERDTNTVTNSGNGVDVVVERSKMNSALTNTAC